MFATSEITIDRMMITPIATKTICEKLNRRFSLPEPLFFFCAITQLRQSDRKKIIPLISLSTNLPIFQSTTYQPTNLPVYLCLLVYLFNYSNPSFIAIATWAVTPGIAVSSSNEASLILSIEPNWFNRALRLAGPIPAMVSSREASPVLVRRLR